MVTVSRDQGRLLSGPEIVTRGVLEAEEEGPVLEEARLLLKKELEEHQAGLNPQWEDVRELVTTVLKRFFKKRLMRRPVIVPAVVEL